MTYEKAQDIRNAECSSGGNDGKPNQKILLETQKGQTDKQ